MPHEVIMPTLGLTMEEGTITEWLKQEGDSVDKEEPLFVVETDKSAVEVGAPAGGVLRKILVQPGQAVAVSTPIAVIAQPGEAGGEVGESAGAAPSAAAAPASTGGPAATNGSAAVAEPVGSAGGTPASGASRAGAGGTPAVRSGADAGRMRVSPRARRVARELGIDLGGLRGTGPEGRIVERDVRAAPAAQAPATAAPERIVASPLARKLAAEHGVDLAKLSGGGPGGRITEKDVTAAVQAGAAAPAAPAAPAMPAVAAAAPAGTFEPLGTVRRITAERMASSARSVASVTLLMEVDMTEAARFRGQLAPEFERRHGARLAYDAMIAKAVAIALREHPDVNARWQEAADGQPAGLQLQAQVNVGIAVAGEQGLLVVVVRDADKKTLEQVNAGLAELVGKSRGNRLGPDEMGGGTFTITNLGSYGVEAFTPIVNPPESAILGVGRIAKRPAVVEDQVVARDLMYLSLTFDHRVVDGAPAAQFLQRVKQVLEAPYVLLA